MRRPSTALVVRKGDPPVVRPPPVAQPVARPPPVTLSQPGSTALVVRNSYNPHNTRLKPAAAAAVVPKPSIEQEAARKDEALKREAARVELRSLRDEAGAYMHQGNIRAAGDVYRKMLTIDPSCVEALDGLDRIRMEPSLIENVIHDMIDTAANTEMMRSILRLWQAPEDPGLTFKTPPANATQAIWRTAAQKVLEPTASERSCWGLPMGSLAGNISAHRLRRALERGQYGGQQSSGATSSRGSHWESECPTSLGQLFDTLRGRQQDAKRRLGSSD